MKNYYALFLVILYSLPAMAQQNCELPEVPYTAVIAGQADSITVNELLQAGKIESANKAFEVLSFMMFAGGNCLSREGMSVEFDCPSGLLTTNAKNYIRRQQPGHRLFFHCIRVRNKVGKVYQLKSLTIRIAASK